MRSNFQKYNLCVKSYAHFRKICRAHMTNDPTYGWYVDLQLVGPSAGGLRQLLCLIHIGIFPMRWDLKCRHFMPKLLFLLVLSLILTQIYPELSFT